jgi:hypothetical protein
MPGDETFNPGLRAAAKGEATTGALLDAGIYDPD